MVSNQEWVIVARIQYIVFPLICSKYPGKLDILISSEGDLQFSTFYVLILTIFGGKKQGNYSRDDIIQWRILVKE